jgi:hypothetical protein
VRPQWAANLAIHSRVSCVPFAYVGMVGWVALLFPFLLLAVEGAIGLRWHRCWRCDGERFQFVRVRRVARTGGAGSEHHRRRPP